MSVFALENGAHDLFDLRGFRQRMRPETVIHQIRAVGCALRHRRLIVGSDDRIGAEPLIKFEARGVAC